MSLSTKWYTFTQNNSGGSFEHFAEDGIGYAVIIEAVDADHANARAKRIGLYFNGCASGRDCSCCGDRWHEASGYDAEDTPQLYGKSLAPIEDGEQPMINWGIPSYMHRIGGEFRVVKESAP